MQAKQIVLIIGSSPDAVQCRIWGKSKFTSIVAINNAWRVRDDWDFLVVPDDFPTDRRPRHMIDGQRIVGSSEYVPANNMFGGIAYAGGTMAFSAGYWALATLRPKVLAFVGCDMIYPSNGPTHFYGSGSPDPLRNDTTLRNLEAKSARLMLHAARKNCACVRLSQGPSRLIFPNASLEELESIVSAGPKAGGNLFDCACQHECDLGYFFESGNYWQHQDIFSTNEIDKLDALWLRASKNE